MAGLVIVTPAAERDRDQHAAYIADDNPEAGRRFYEAFAATVMKLGVFPEMGPMRAFRRAELAGLRMMRVEEFHRYLIFYRPTTEGVEIIRLLHSSQDIRGIFEGLE